MLVRMICPCLVKKNQYIVVINTLEIKNIPPTFEHVDYYYFFKQFVVCICLCFQSLHLLQTSLRPKFQLRPFNYITSLVFTYISLACTMILMLEVNMSGHVNYYFIRAIIKKKNRKMKQNQNHNKKQNKTSMILASLEHNNLPHFVLYFLLAEHGFFFLFLFWKQQFSYHGTLSTVCSQTSCFAVIF